MTLETYHAFVIFARDNPELYDVLVAKLREMKDLGWHFYSVKTCWDVVRFDYDKINGPDQDEYKLNDKYQSLYSRFIYAREEDLRGFYEMRKVKGMTSKEVFARLNDDFQTGFLLAEEPLTIPLEELDEIDELSPLELLPPKKATVDPDHREWTEDIANAF